MGQRFKSYGMKGKKHSLETLEKMRISHTLNPTKYWLGKKMSKEHRLKMSVIRKGKLPKNYKLLNKFKSGELNPAWKGGVTPINTAIRQSSEYKLWRKAVFERDEYKCVWCNKKGRNLNADHIKPFALFPELRFAIDNGRTLCVPCHKKTDTYGKTK